MPPSKFNPSSVYQPLDVGSEASPLPGWLLNNPYKSFNDVLTEQQQMQARDIATQAAQINLQEKKDEIEKQKQFEEIIKKAAISQQPEMDVNVDDMLQKLQVGAAQVGDMDSILSIEKIKNNRRGMGAPIAGEVRDAIDKASRGEDFILPENISTSEAALINRARNSFNNQKALEGMNNRFYDPSIVEGRNLRNERQEQVNTGTQVRPLTAQQADQIGAAQGFNDYINNVKETYLPDLEQNRAIRFGEMMINPNSPAARLQNELALAAKSAAAAIEKGGRLSDQDFKILSDVVKINPLDTYETTVNKLDRLKDYVQAKVASQLSSAKKAGFNTSGFETKIPKAASGEPQSKDDYIKRRKEEILQQMRQQAGF